MPAFPNPSALDAPLSFPHPQPKQREFSEMPQKPARLGAAEGEKRHQRNINTKFAISFAPDRMEPGGSCSFPFNQELS